MKGKLFIKNTDLQYELIISNGKGYLTNNAEQMLIRIVNELIKKFKYETIELYEDCRSEAYLMIFSNWKKYDHTKYDTPFPYFTEIAKRGLASGLNRVKGKKQWMDDPVFISLSSFRA